MVDAHSNVVALKREHEKLKGHGLDGGGGPPHDEGMEARLAKLEGVIPNLATKVDVEALRGDLHKMDASIVRWMIATILTLFLGFAGLFFTMQNSIHVGMARTTQPAVPVAAPAPPPIIIQLPPQQIQATAPAQPPPPPAKP